MSNNLGSYPDNALTNPEHMQCVYALSGTYGLLPRLLYYVTLIFAIFGRHREWLIIGALVTAMCYAGTSSIHQMTLAASRAPVYDLDILGAWAIISTGALAYIAMMHWSSTLRDSHVRIIFIVWGVLIGIGLIFGRSEIFSTPLGDSEPACYSKTGELLIYPLELVEGAFNCTYQCFGHRKPMRQQSEVMAVPRSTLENYYTGLGVVLIGPIQFVAYAALSIDSLGHSPSRLCTYIILSHLEPKHHERLYNFIFEASSESWYGGYFTLVHFARRTNKSVLKTILLFMTIPWFAMGVLIDILSLPMLVINIVLNELTIMKSQLPTNEANFAIGQWGPWVSSALVVFATILNQFMQWHDRYSKRKRAAKEAKEASNRTSDDDSLHRRFEAATELEEQMTGVVKPSLAHVPTLQILEMGKESRRP